MKSNAAQDWNIFPFYQPVDLYRALSEGKLPETFIPKGRYDEHLLESVLPVVFSMPLFHDFQSGLKLKSCTAFRKGDDTPTITTGYQLSVDEVAALRADPNVFVGFMNSMGNALAEKSLPFDEVFACIMDGVYTAEYIIGNTLHSVH